MLSYLRKAGLFVLSLIPLVAYWIGKREGDKRADKAEEKADEAIQVADEKVRKAEQRLKEQEQINDKFDSVDIDPNDIKVGLDD